MNAQASIPYLSVVAHAGFVLERRQICCDLVVICCSGLVFVFKFSCGIFKRYPGNQRNRNLRRCWKHLPCEDLARSLPAPCKNVAKTLLDRLLVAYLQAGESMVASPTADVLCPYRYLSYASVVRTTTRRLFRFARAMPWISSKGTVQNGPIEELRGIECVILSRRSDLLTRIASRIWSRSRGEGPRYSMTGPPMELTSKLGRHSDPEQWNFSPFPAWKCAVLYRVAWLDALLNF